MTGWVKRYTFFVVLALSFCLTFATPKISEASLFSSVQDGYKTASGTIISDTASVITSVTNFFSNFFGPKNAPQAAAVTNLQPTVVAQTSSTETVTSTPITEQTVTTKYLAVETSPKIIKQIVNVPSTGVSQTQFESALSVLENRIQALESRGLGYITVPPDMSSWTREVSVISSGSFSNNLSVSSNATSTFAGGINITSGCFAVNGTCVTGSGSGAATWGAITGTLSAQTDLQNALNGRLSLSAWFATTTDALAQGSTNKYYSSTLFNNDFAGKTTTDLAEGTNLYYTPARVAALIAGTTTDALAEGINNLYFTNTRADNRINATSTISTLLSLPNLSTLGTITSGTWNGTRIGVGYGGTGLAISPSYGQVLLGNASGGYDLVATSSLGITSGISSQWTTTGNDIYYATGNVGVGTTSPGSAFAVNGTTTITKDISLGSASKIIWPGTFSGNMIYSSAANQIDIVGVNSGIHINRSGIGDVYFDRDLTVAAANKAIFNGNVGIGTSSPYAKLSVAGDVVGTNLTATGTLTVAGDSTFGSGNNQIVISTASGRIEGNAGFGLNLQATTIGGSTLNLSNAGATFSNTLTVGGNISADTTGSGNILSWPQGSLTWSNGNFGKLTSNTELQLVGSASGVLIPNVAIGAVGLRVKGASGQTADIFQVQNNTPTTLFNITAAGNVGIGTTSPYKTLSVAGDIVGTNILATSTLSVGSGAIGGAGLTISNAPTVTTISANGNELLVTGGGSTNGVRLGSGYDVFIDAPTHRTTFGYFGGGSKVSVLGNVAIGSTYYSKAAPTDGLIVEGNVGIGTSSPYAKLSVVGNIVADNFISTSTTSTTTFAGGFSAAGASGLTVLQNGNVGIGTQSPSQKLYVNGNIMIPFTNYIYFGDLNHSITAVASVGMTIADINALTINSPTTVNANFTAGPSTGISTITYKSFGTSDSIRMQFKQGSSIKGQLAFGGSNEGNNDTYFDYQGNLYFHQGYQGATSTVITSTGNIGIGTSTPLAKLEIAGALRISSTTQDLFHTPAGSDVGTKINIPTFNPGAFGQIVAMGLPSSADTTSRVLSIFDNRASAHQPSLNVFSPNENEFGGFSWEGGNSALTIKSTQDIEFKTSNNAGGQVSFPNSSYASFTFPTPGLTRGNIHLLPGNANDGTTLGITFGAGDNTLTDQYNNAQAGIYAQTSSQYGSRLYFGTTNNYSTGSMVRMTIDSTGNIGIGTTSPFAALSVNAAAGATSFAIGSSTATNFIVDKNGNVGIGTSNPSAPFSLTSGGLSITMNANFAGGGSYIDLGQVGTINGSGGVMTYGAKGRPLVLGIGSGGTTGAVTVQTSGNVGIGTSSPFTTLSVAGSTYVGGNLTATGTLSIYTGSINILTAKPNTGSGTGANVVITGSDGGSNRSALYVAGAVSGNSAEFGGTGGSVPFSAKITTSASNTGLIVQGASSQSANLQEWRDSNGVVLDTVSATGNFGVGTSTPSGKLTIQAPSSGNALEIWNSFGTLDKFRVDNNGNLGIDGNITMISGSKIGLDTTNYYLNFSSSGAATLKNYFGVSVQNALGEVARIGSSQNDLNSYFNGNVGIGTTSPYAKISIAGSAGGTTNLFAISTSTSGFSTSTAFIIDSNGNVGINMNSTTTAQVAISGALSLSLPSGSVVAGFNNAGYLNTSGINTIFGSNNTLAGNVSNNNQAVLIGQSNTGGAGAGRVLEVAVGISNTVSTHRSIALGYNNTSGGDSSTAVGVSNSIGGFGTAGAFGYTNTISATGAYAIGANITNAIANSVQIGPSDASKLTILSTGNVGIGTTSPNWNLQIAGSRPYLTLTDTSAGTDMKHWFASSQGGSFYIGTSSDLLNATSTFFKLNPTQGIYAIGKNAASTTIMTGNIAIGNNALSSNTSTSCGGGDNIAIGSNALTGLTGGSCNGHDNVAIGTNANQVGNVSFSTIIGSKSGGQFSSGDNNTFMGYQVGYWSPGSNNTAFGAYSFNAHSAATFNTVIGELAAGASNGGYTGSNATLLGYKSGYSLTSGGNNLFLGFQAASTTSSGSNNIAIGYNVKLPSNTGNNQLNIGNIIYGTGIDGEYDTLSSGNIGIGTSTNLIKRLTINGAIGTVAEGDIFSQYDGNSATTYPIIARYWDSNATFPASTYIFGNGTNSRVGIEKPGSQQISHFQVRAVKATFDGNVGIGTTSPASTLTVTGSACISKGAGATAACSTTAGTITANVFNTASADLAERYKVTDTSIEAGDIVALDTTSNLTVKRAEKNKEVFGIVSTAPGFLLGSTNLDDAVTRPVALAGRVPVKVSMEGGEIKVGDYLTISSTPGIAMKAGTSTKIIIGTALESASNDGKVNVFVRSSLAQGINLDSKEAIQTELVKDNSSLLSDFNALIAGSSEWMQARVTAATGFFKNIFAGSVTTKKLKVLDGIDMTDKQTGEPYCLVISGGVLQQQKGTCDNPQQVQPVVNNTETQNPISTTTDGLPPVVIESVSTSTTPISEPVITDTITSTTSEIQTKTTQTTTDTTTTQPSIQMTAITDSTTQTSTTESSSQNTASTVVNPTSETLENPTQ